MKYIITESQRDILAVRRRLPEFKQLIRNLFPWSYPCYYHSLEQYIMSIKQEMFETLTLDWFEKVSHEVIWDIVQKLYMDDMVKHYESNCGQK